MQFEYDPEYLITAVSKRPGLWDYNHPDYRAKNVRFKLWGEVVKELMPADLNITKGEMRELELQIQKKWKSIRDCFHKYVANPNRTKRPYLYSKQLQFILKDQKLPKRTPTLKREDASSESAEELEYKPRPSAWKPRKRLKIGKNDDVSDDENDTYEVPDDYLTEDSAMKSDGLAEVKGNSQSDNPQQFAFANVDACSKSDSEDSDKMFLISLLPHLKSIPEEFKLNAKMELMQVLQQANYSVAKLI